MASFALPLPRLTLTLTGRYAVIETVPAFGASAKSRRSSLRDISTNTDGISTNTAGRSVCAAFVQLCCRATLDEPLLLSGKLRSSESLREAQQTGLRRKRRNSSGNLLSLRKSLI